MAYDDSEDHYEFVLRGDGSPRALWMSWRGTTTPDTIAGRMGFELVNSTSRWPGSILTDRAVLVPWWCVFVVSLAATLRWTFFRERRLFWRKVGCCAACGYDLRESRDRCPECGATPAKALS
jgi:hypothetical protein